MGLLMSADSAAPPETTTPSGPNRLDLLIALAIGVLAVLIYALASAPDMLYSDSGEFQALAYTWGTTHSTGYPVYLILARLVGLIPLHSLAWRVTFFSVLSGGAVIGMIYLLARYFTQRGGALLASVVVLLSYTFWAQSIIAEVYTPALAFICLILVLVFAWRTHPAQRRGLLFLAGLLMGLGLGVHMFLVLIGPAVLVFVLWGPLAGPPEERGHWDHLARLALGGILGLVGFYLLFAFIDTRPTVTNFLDTSIIPSRDAWNLSLADFDSTPKRFWVTFSGVQWRDAMLPGDLDYGANVNTFFNDYLSREYTVPALLLAVLGAVAALVQRRRHFALVLVALGVAFFAGLVYQPGDKFIFYLPVYVLVGLLAGVGAGALLTVLSRPLPAGPLRLLLNTVLALILIGLCVGPLLASRWQAVETGESRFVTENYPYPVQDLAEPRREAECAVSKVAEDHAVLVLDWRAMYSIYYVAHVEQGRTGLVLHEARPHGTDVITASLRDEIAAQIAAGVPVYVDNQDPTLRRSYTFTSVPGTCRDYNLFALTTRN